MQPQASIATKISTGISVPCRGNKTLEWAWAEQRRVTNRMRTLSYLCRERPATDCLRDGWHVIMLPSVSPFFALYELRRSLLRRFIGILLQRNDAMGFNLNNPPWWISIFHTTYTWFWAMLILTFMFLPLVRSGSFLVTKMSASNCAFCLQFPCKWTP